MVDNRSGRFARSFAGCALAGALLTLFYGCATQPAPNAFAGVSVLAQALTARVTNFKGTGVSHSYDSSYESAWAALFQFATDQKQADGSKIIAKDPKAGWIMTEKKTGWITASHDIYFLERSNDAVVRIEVVSRTSANPKSTEDLSRAAAIHDDLTNVLTRTQ